MDSIKGISDRLLLVILDGFAKNDLNLKNAVEDAYTPHLDYLFHHYPYTTIASSGTAVGLPEGIVGNSEVGHMNIGAGRRVLQDLVKIDEAIQDGSFFTKEYFQELTKYKRIHILGLLSDGGVHAHIDHFKAIIDYFKDKDNQLYLHPFMDGRDTPIDSGVSFVKELGQGNFKIASIMGRFFAMDRDKRYDRIAQAYRTLIGQGDITETDPLTYLQNEYRDGRFDEFITPTLLLKEGAIQKDDAVFFINFRPDRAIELVEAFNLPNYQLFERPIVPAYFLRITPNSVQVNIPTLFDKDSLHNGLVEYLSNLGKKQFKIAETEKYAHVTYFFNGGRQEAFPNEEQILIPSPRDVKTYDLRPQMSAFLVLDKLLEKLQDKSITLYVVNFANTDMVGHTGDYLAAVKAVKFIDQCVGKLVQRVREEKMSMILTADHGNSDQMIYSSHLPHTAHTSYPVPFVFFHPDLNKEKIELNGNNFALKDIAPTILHALNIDSPKNFQGKSIFK